MGLLKKDSPAAKAALADRRAAQKRVSKASSGGADHASADWHNANDRLRAARGKRPL